MDAKEIAQPLANFVEASSGAMKLASEIVDEVEREKTAAADLIPNIIKRAKDLKLIDEADEKTASAELATLPGALNGLNQMMDVLEQQQKTASPKTAGGASLGRGGQPETAVKQGSRVILQTREQDGLSESDKVIMRLGGLPVE